MLILIGGLALFIAVHLVPTRPSLRAGLVGRLGPGAYTGLFSLVSIAGLVLIVLGYGHMQGLGRGNPAAVDAAGVDQARGLSADDPGHDPAGRSLCALAHPLRRRPPDADRADDLGVRAPACQRRPRLGPAVRFASRLRRLRPAFGGRPRLARTPRQCQRRGAQRHPGGRRGGTGALRRSCCSGVMPS